jgi:hypothetical protein
MNCVKFLAMPLAAVMIDQKASDNASTLRRFHESEMRPIGTPMTTRMITIAKPIAKPSCASERPNSSFTGSAIALIKARSAQSSTATNARTATVHQAVRRDMGLAGGVELNGAIRV